jgi:hypothetical protein
VKQPLALRVSTWIARLCCLAPALVPTAGSHPGAADFAQVPGVVIDHLPASGGVFVGSPGIVVLTNGDYVASHDFFGPKSTEHTRAVTAVFRARDRGLTWRKIATIDGQFWSSLFVNQGALYLLGTDKHHGNAVIRRSLDGGQTWTMPADAATGLLRGDAQYHCAPTPVIEHAGRLWRGIERRIPPTGWGGNYCAGVMSAPVNADLLNAANWTFSNFLPSSRRWNGGDMGGWLEGNVVVTPAGQVLDILRVDTARPPEKAAMVLVSPNGRNLSFDPATGFIDLPGGAKKFTIRQDPKGHGYWTLASIAPEGGGGANRGLASSATPAGIRNTLALLRSSDLRQWKVCGILLHHPDAARHAFQYVDWQFDGDDIIAACRTAYDDGQGGAHSGHDANFLTFHRIQKFRALAAD